ncbi:hypothetical protein E8E11_002512 [Didymella keratinophila]|nr:hypothetical protein E8E11_002512 [Didymella keratinophila]
MAELRRATRNSRKKCNTSKASLRRAFQSFDLFLQYAGGDVDELWRRSEEQGLFKKVPQQVMSDVLLFNEVFRDKRPGLKLALVPADDLEDYINHSYAYCKLLVEILRSHEPNSSPATTKRKRIASTPESPIQGRELAESQQDRAKQDALPALPPQDVPCKDTVSLRQIMDSNHLQNPILLAIVASNGLRVLWDDWTSPRIITDNMWKMPIRGSTDWTVGGYCNLWWLLHVLPDGPMELESAEIIELPVQKIPNIWPEVESCEVVVFPVSSKSASRANPVDRSYQRTVLDAELYIRVTREFGLLQGLQEETRGEKQPSWAT